MPRYKFAFPVYNAVFDEKIVYRVILQMVRNSSKYNSTKEICVAIDKGSFEPITDNLPDIYIKCPPTTKPCPHNNIKLPSWLVSFLRYIHF